MARKVFTDEEVKRRSVRRAALVLFELWEEDRGAHSRLLELLLPDSYILVGTSVNGGGWREHLVPLAFIRDQCFKLFCEGKGIEEAAQYIDQHLKIAHITREEREKIDVELGLRSKMPETWEPGDFLARLKAAGINIVERLDDSMGRTQKHV